MLESKLTEFSQQFTDFDPQWSDFNQILDNKEQVIDRLQLESEIEERIRQITFDVLRSEFKPVPTTNLFVRGSLARGDFPCDDVDVFHYGPTDEYQPNLWPSTGVTRPVNYDHIPKTDLEECFATSACMSCTSLDCRPITHADARVERVISQTRQELFTTRKSYYLLFRLLEERWNGHLEADLYQGYDALKRFPGSKRTTQRIFWILQATIPQYQDFISSKTLFLKAREDGLLSDDVVLSMFTVMKSVKNPRIFNEENFKRAAGTVRCWYHSTLEPRVLSGISSELPDDYLEATFTAFDRQTTPGRLSDIARNHNKITPSAKWLLTWSLSGNPSCPREELYSLWESLLGKVAYRCVLQNLLYNPSFPRERVSGKEVEYDTTITCLLEPY